MSHDSNQEKIAISSEVYNQVESRITHMEFNSVDEYVSFVMGEVLQRVNPIDEQPQDVDEQDVQERLKSLGYLNE